MTNPLPDSLDGTSKMDRNLIVPSKILPVNSKKTVPSLDLPLQILSNRNDSRKTSQSRLPKKPA